MANKDKSEDELRPEYEEAFLKGGVRGKYAERYESTAKVVRIAPDVATSFPDDESVNEALRWVLRVTNDTSRLATRRAGAADTSGREDVGQFFSDSDLLEVG